MGARSGKHLILLLALCLGFVSGLGVPVFSRADDSAPDSSEPAASTTPEAASPAAAIPTDQFLQLPAYDLDPEQKETSYKVGDTVSVRISGLKGISAAPHLGVPEGSSSLTELGFAETQGPSQNPDGEWVFHLGVIKKGELAIPSLAVVGADGKPIGRTNPLKLNVDSVISPQDQKAQEPAPLRPPVGLPFPIWAVVFTGIFVLLLVALAGYGIYRLVRRFKPEPKAAPAAPPRPEHEIALEALAEIEAKGWISAGRFKQHYFAISEVMKRYLGARYGFEAPESTTEELIQLLESGKKAPDAVVDQVENIFDRLDPVKFTDLIPGHEEAKQVLLFARELVTSTKRVPAPAPVMASNGKGPHAV